MFSSRAGDHVRGLLPSSDITRTWIRGHRGRGGGGGGVAWLEIWEQAAGGGLG